MFDKELVLESLRNIQKVLLTITERSSAVKDADDFASSPEGVLRMDAICMNLIALGEAVKGLDKLTRSTLLCDYPEISWKDVMRMRDKIAHH